MQITRKEKGVTQVVTENWKRKDTDGKRYSSSDKQAGRERRREGRRRDRERKKKSASWSAVALSNYKPKRDMSWQVDRQCCVRGSGSVQQQWEEQAVTVHTTLWVGVVQMERLCQRKE